MASSTLLSLPNVAKISRTCSCATLRVSLPTCSLVVLTSAARPPSFAAAFPSPPFVASSAFAGAFVLASFSGGRSAGSLAFAPLAAASLRSLGGGDRGGLVPEEVPLELDEPEPLPLPLLLPDPELEPELPEDDGDGDFLPAMAIAVGVRRGSRQAGGLQSPIDARISFRWLAGKLRAWCTSAATPTLQQRIKNVLWSSMDVIKGELMHCGSTLHLCWQRE